MMITLLVKGVLAAALYFGINIKVFDFLNKIIIYII